jgi:hypothetical protein
VTIRSLTAFVGALWDWAVLRECFPRGIRPTDIDGMVEMGGRYLILEGKNPNVPVPVAQQRMFDSMLRWNRLAPGLFTVIVFWGDAATQIVTQIQFWGCDPIAADLAMLREHVRAWAIWAEEHAAERA